MLLTIEVPSKDYAAIEQWIKRGKIVMPEILGRVYEVSGNGVTVTAEILSERADILYAISDCTSQTETEIKSMVCAFPSYGVIVAFEVDKSYE